MYPRFENFPRMTESAVSIQPTRNAGARILVKLDTETTARKSPLTSSGFFAKYFPSTLQNRSGKVLQLRSRMWYTSSAMMWNLYSCASLTNSSRAFCGIVTPCGFECDWHDVYQLWSKQNFSFLPQSKADIVSRIELIGLINLSPSFQSYLQRIHVQTEFHSPSLFPYRGLRISLLPEVRRFLLYDDIVRFR